jgi:hypothetical protein
VQIDSERPDISEPVPDRASHREIDWLDFNSEPQAIESVDFGQIRLHGAESTRHLSLAGDSVLER